MASFIRSSATAGSRSISVIRSKTLTPKAMPSLFSSSRRATPCASRIAMALGSAESLMPLHSAIASARLKSILAVNSSCWSWLSQGLALPL